MNRTLSLLLIALISGCDWISDDDFRQQIDPDGDGIDAGLDCDDQDPSVLVAPIWYADADGDGEGDPQSPFTTPGDPSDPSPCAQPEGYVANSDDCDDQDPLVNSASTWWADADGDDHGDWLADTFNGCSPPSDIGWVPGVLGAERDCDDDDDSVYPGAPEVCEAGVPRAEQVDNNCDGDPTDGIATSFAASYIDRDGDDFGDPDTLDEYCEAPPADRVANGLDCDDQDPDAYPGALDVTVDGIDQDCNGFDGLADADQDGFRVDVDCNDDDPTIYPGAPDPIGDGINADCDPTGVDGKDGDGDGHARVDGALGDDCNDEDPEIYGGTDAAPERCDEVDWDCDGSAYPPVPTLTALDASYRGMAGTADLNDLDPSAVALGVCGVIEDFTMALPVRSFEVIGFSDPDTEEQAALCPSSIDAVPLFETPAGADYTNETLVISNLRVSRRVCTPGSTDGRMLMDLGTTGAGTLVLDRVALEDLDLGASTGIRVNGFAVDLARFEAFSVTASTILSFTNVDLYADRPRFEGNTVATAGLGIYASGGVRTAELLYPWSKANRGDGAIFDLEVPATITHPSQNYEYLSACVFPTEPGGGITPFPAVAGPDHQENDSVVFRASTDIAIEQGVFEANRNSSIVLALAEGDGIAEFRSLMFIDNEAADGGAIHITTGNAANGRWSTTITGSTFDGNTVGGDGGALFSDAPGSVVSQLNTYCDNASYQNGGAVYVGNNSTLSSTDDHFMLNNAGVATEASGPTNQDATGGALYVTNGSAVMSGAWFGGNFVAGRGGSNIAHALGGALVGYNIRADRNNSTRPDASLTAFSLVGGGTLTMSRITDWNDPQSVIRAGATCFEMPEVQAGNNATWLNYVFCAGSSGACTSDPAPLSEKLCP